MTPELFVRLTDSFPDAALLVTSTGSIRAGNRALGRLGIDRASLIGRALEDVATTSQGPIAEYLKACQRTASPLPGLLLFRSLGGLRVRCHGNLVAPATETEPAQILLRLTEERTSLRQFTLLNAKIAELEREVRRRRETEAELRVESERLQITLSSIGDAVIVTDVESRITRLNPTAEFLTAWLHEEAFGQPLTSVFRIVNEETRQPAENPVDKALREGVVVGLANHTILIARNGREYAIDDSAAPIYSADGAVEGVVLVFRDITERRKTEETLRQHARITETLYRVSRTLTEEMELGRLVQIITDEATHLTDAEFGAFFYNIRDERGESYMLYTLSGAPSDAFTGFPLPRNTAVFEPTFRGEAVVRVDDITQDPRYGQNAPYAGMPPGHLPVRSYLAVPVISRSGDVLGGLFCGHSRAGVFTERHEHVLAGLASHAAIAVDHARMYHASQASERQFRELADSMPQVVWAARPDGTVDYYNRRWYEQFANSEVLIGDESWIATLHPHDAPRTLQRWQASVRAGESFENECRYRDRVTEAWRWHLERAVPIRNDAGEIVRWFGTSTDIDDQKRNENSLRFLAESSVALSALLDLESILQRIASLAVPDLADCCIVYLAADDGGLRPLAVAHAEDSQRLVAQRLAERHPPNRTTEIGAYEVFRTGRSQLLPEVTEDLLHRMAADPEHFRSLCELGLKSYIGAPLVIREKTVGVMVFLTSGSGRLYNRFDLRIADEIARRSAVAIENSQLYSEIQDASRRKDEFLAMLAHELRNPLVPIRTGLDLLKIEGADATITAPMQEQVNHLVRLVDDLLDVSRIIRGRIPLQSERVDVATIVQRAIETVRPVLKAQNHALDVSLPETAIWVHGDQVRLTQVLTNLLNNAAKYTAPGGQVWLSAREESGFAVLSVRDNGTGIDKALLPRVFELFTQSDRTLDRAQGGLGIGLTLVRTLIEKHGGSVLARSEGENRGSEFIVRLPLVRAPEEGPQEPAALGPAKKALRILVVDDNVGSAVLLRRLILKTGDHQVQVAHEGTEALRMAKEHKPDLILLDIGLPGISGYEVARQLRQDRSLERCRLVALTGYGSEEDRRKSRESGFDEHLVKPPSLSQLQTLLQHPALTENA